MSKRHKKPRISWRSKYLWHRYLGLCSALFLIVLSVTGLLLNHTEDLQLDSHYIKSKPLLNWYGVSVDERLLSFKVNNHWITQTDNRLFFDAQQIQQLDTTLIGAVSLGDMIVIALQNKILLLTPHGEIIERIGHADGAPAGMQAVAIFNDEQLLIRAAHGNYMTDSQFLDWQDSHAEPKAWVSAASLPQTLRGRLLDTVRHSILSQERVMLDIHSGRFLGPWGVYLVDAAAIMFLLLTGLGIWVWASRKR